MSELEQRQAVVAEALTWLGTPHHHQGRIKGAGVDCGMFLLEVFHRCGLIPHVEPGEYPHDWHLHRGEERYLGHVERFASRIPGPPQPGDIVLFRFGACASHGAIVVEWPRVVHSYLGRGVILDDVTANHALAQRLVGFWSTWAKGDA